jgi:tetratricopeptide (TPR) repeat protein
LATAQGKAVFARICWYDDRRHSRRQTVRTNHEVTRCEASQALNPIDAACIFFAAREGVCAALKSLGDANNMLRRPEKAIECDEQALAIRRELKDQSGEAEILRIAGLAYATQRNRKAVEYYEQALAINREMKKQLEEARVLLYLGDWYGSNDYSQSVDYYEKGLAVARKIKERSLESLLLGRLGSTYTSLGNNAKASEYQEQVLLIHRMSGNKRGEAFALVSLAFITHSQNPWEKAIQYLEQALSKTQKIL